MQHSYSVFSPGELLKAKQKDGLLFKPSPDTYKWFNNVIVNVRLLVDFSESLSRSKRAVTRLKKRCLIRQKCAKSFFFPNVLVEENNYKIF